MSKALNTNYSNEIIFTMGYLHVAVSFCIRLLINCTDLNVLQIYFCSVILISVQYNKLVLFNFDHEPKR